MLDLLMLALLAASFAALAAFVHVCEALTRRDDAGRERVP
jgi:hypothetical protein